MDCKYSIYVPSTNNVNEKCDSTGMVNYVLAELSKMFGGATASRSVGAWMSDAEGLVLEEVTIVYAFCTSEQATKHFPDVYAICERIKSEMNQEAVTLEYNGQVKFV